MPHFNEATPRSDLTIAGSTFSIPAPFTEGYTLNSREADALNQLLKENVRNNLAPKIEGLTQQAVDEYVLTYEFNVRRGGGGGASLNPVEKKARTIARERIQSALKERNMRIDLKTEEGKAWMEEKVAEVAARPEIIKLAERQLRDLEKLALDGLNLTTETGEAPEAPEAQAA
jgi:hypothetical protein